jgi:hypothetical protein
LTCSDIFLEFSSTTTSGDVAAKVDDPALLVKASTLLGLPQEELKRCLTSKNIGTRSIITCTYTPAQVILEIAAIDLHVLTDTPGM